jgi:prepilin-type N-terminal cleavage/methylation domain-containing protein
LKKYPFNSADREKGFTLIELLVVIAIIGLLSSIILAALSTARQKGQDASTLEEVHQIQNALAEYYNDNGFYPYCSSGGLCCVGNNACVYGGGTVSTQVSLNVGGPAFASLDPNNENNLAATAFSTYLPPLSSPPAVTIPGVGVFQGYLYSCTIVGSTCTQAYISYVMIGKTSCPDNSEIYGTEGAILCYIGADDTLSPAI